MDITKGSLDDITRPASSERSRPGSRVSANQTQRSLEILSSEISNTQDNKSLHEDTRCQSENISSDQDISDEKNVDQELQKAINKMKRLDEILSARLANEREVKKRGRELHQRLWQELKELNVTRSSVSSEETENTRTFLSLTQFYSDDANEEVDFVPVFSTQTPGEEHNTNDTNECERAKETKPSGVASSSEGDQKVGRQGGAAWGKPKQDFVRKNIELAGGVGNLALMTRGEKQRLEELLKDLEEDGEDADKSSNPEADAALCVLSAPSGEGYTPEPSELQRLLHIDARLQLLLPAEDFLSVRSPNPDPGLPQARDPGCGGRQGAEQRLPWQGVLQDMRETRAQETRLSEIQQQLKTLEQDQNHTEERPVLPEEQLQALLRECESALSVGCPALAWPGEGDPGPPRAPGLFGRGSSLLAGMPRLCSSALSQLLKEPCGNPTSPRLAADADPPQDAQAGNQAMQPDSQE